MTPQEFSRLAIRLVGTPVEWQPRLAHDLGLPEGMVHAWADGRSPVPPAVADRLNGDPRPSEPAVADEWIRGQGLALSNEAPRDYLIHATAPRFVGRLRDSDLEAQSDRRALQVDAETWLTDVVWFDPCPAPGDLDGLMAAAAHALEVGERRH